MSDDWGGWNRWDDPLDKQIRARLTFGDLTRWLFGSPLRDEDPQAHAARVRWRHRLRTRARDRYEAERRSLRPVVVKTRAAYGRRRGHARLG